MTYDDVVWKYPKALLYRMLSKSRRYKADSSELSNDNSDDGFAIDDAGYLDLADSDNIDELQRKLKQMAKR